MKKRKMEAGRDEGEDQDALAQAADANMLMKPTTALLLTALAYNMYLELQEVVYRPFP